MNSPDREKIVPRPELAEVGTLTPYAVEIRYPGHGEQIAEEDIEAALKLAESMLVWARETIADRP